MTAYWRQNRLERLRRAKGYAGVRRAGYNRQTGTLVVVCKAEPAGLDPADGECAWYTICEDHSEAVGHRTLTLAQWHAASPADWCSQCQAIPRTWRRASRNETTP